MRDFSVKHKFPKYKIIFKFSLKPQSRQTAVMRGLFCRNCNFHTKLSSFCWHIPIFTFLLFGLQFSTFYFKLFTFRFKILRKKKFQFFNFMLADSNFHASAFHTSVFRLSIVRFQLFDFCWRFQFSRFCFVNFLRKPMLIF